jgi:hypothetical protein
MGREGAVPIPWMIDPSVPLGSSHHNLEAGKQYSHGAFTEQHHGRFVLGHKVDQPWLSGIPLGWAGNGSAKGQALCRDEECIARGC